MIFSENRYPFFGIMLRLANAQLWLSCTDSRLLRLQRAVRAGFVDDVGQVLRQQLERRSVQQAELPREFLNLGVAENGLELIFADRKIGARPEPGLYLRIQAALLQRGDQAIEIVILRLGQHRIEDSGQRSRFSLAQDPSQHTAEIEVVQQAHVCLQAK